MRCPPRVNLQRVVPSSIDRSHAAVSPPGICAGASRVTGRGHDAYGWSVEWATAGTRVAWHAVGQVESVTPQVTPTRQLNMPDMQMGSLHVHFALVNPSTAQWL